MKLFMPLLLLYSTNCTLNNLSFKKYTNLENIKNILKIKQNQSKCWNDINFKKTEKLLLESKVKSLIPFYKYYKNQEIKKGKLKIDIEKRDLFYIKKKKET